MLKILRSGNDSIVLAVSGRIDESDLPDLQAALDTEFRTHDLTLDLAEVRLVHRTALRFLAECEAKGIKLKNCPTYIREWFAAERRSSRE